MKIKLFLFICLLTALSNSSCIAATTPEKAYDFRLKDLSGKMVRLSDHKNKVVVVNFWATWCPPCRSEMPSIQAFYNKFKNQGVALLAINLDGKNAGFVKSFMDKNKYSFPVLLDDNGKTANSYGVRGIPATFVIDRTGRIVDRHIGSFNWMENAFTKKIKALCNPYQPI